MGSGYRDFVPGEQLTADIVDGYLMRQTVMTFASATARNTALSGVLDDGMVAYLEDTFTYTAYDGTTWRDICTLASDTAVTPTLTNVTLGTGSTNLQRWTRRGRHVKAWGKIIIGTGGSASGNIGIGLPVASASLSLEHSGGHAYLTDASGDNAFAWVFIPTGGGSSAQLRLGAANNQVDNDTPWTWAVGDIIYYWIEYETA